MTMTRKNKPIRRRAIACYGWMPDLPDQRDYLYAAPLRRLGPLPSRVDMRSQCPPVYSQGVIGSCTANAIAGAIEFDLLKQELADFIPSRLFIYYNERVMEHSVSSDNGAQIRDGVKSVNQLGVCPESQWPYVPTPANPTTNIWAAGAKPAQKPPAACYKEALNHQVVSYQRVNRDLAQMKGCLAAGYPFVFGFTVYESFESAAVKKTGVLNMPASSEVVVGGHAVMVVGYDDPSKRFIVRNSWSANWGQQGYFTIPYDYLLTSSLARDFWTIRMVEG
jgi:C1A family cysteine protease